MIYVSKIFSAASRKHYPLAGLVRQPPYLDWVVNCLSAGWVGLFGLLNYTQMQTRIRTTFNGWLDLTARDFFNHRIVRRQKRETDNSFRGRIFTELLRDRCTRAAVYDLLLDLTGRPPIIFEPTNPQDTGCYGSHGSPGTGGAAYGMSGGWGNLNLPFQAFVRAFRAETPGIAMVNGWGEILEVLVWPKRAHRFGYELFAGGRLPNYISASPIFHLR